MKRFLFLSIFFVVSLPLTFVSGNALKPEPPNNSEEIAYLESAILDSVGAERGNLMRFLAADILVENVNISQDGRWGVGWVVPIDRLTGEPAPIEPGVVVSYRDEADWQVWLPSSEGWLDQLKALPEDVIHPEVKESLINQSQEIFVAAPAAALTGYKLPWEAGIQRKLTQSTCHDQYSSNTDAHHAFDFSTTGEMWNTHAAKAGVVWLWRDDYPTCLKTTCSDEQGTGNYIILKDETTNPITYQLYLHLAEASIPDQIKVRGTPIAQGQFIGIVDNTGQSWGHHLHFQIQLPVYGVENYWGRAVDIVFEDVSINGGRPRVINSWCDDEKYCDDDDVCDTFQTYYTSQNAVNTDSTAPTGDLLTPKNSTIFSASAIQLQGQATDDKSGLEHAQFIAFYNDNWQNVGPQFSTATFSYSWNFCQDDVPDGPLALALLLEDQAGNQNLTLPGLRIGAKQFECPPTPNCTPGPDQIAIFEAPNYQGKCKVLGIGDYATTALFTPVRNDQIESILVGQNVLATVFSGGSYTGRAETLETSDPNLSENRVGSNSISALKIRPQALPQTPTPQWPEFGENFLESDSIFLAWNDTLGASQFRAKLEGPTGTELSDWSGAATWNLGSLTPGVYSWQVQGKNASGTSVWSDLMFFIVNNDTSTMPASVNPPYTASMEGNLSNWRSTGFWHLTEEAANSATHSWVYNQQDTGDYASDHPNSGDLTSPPINLPVTANPYRLQFVYKANTEGIDPVWDQRWVQISVDGGEFFNIRQLFSDPQNEWLTAQIDLSPYYTPAQAHTIRVRFHFASGDENKNTQQGWYIDDVSLGAAAPVTCAAGAEPNNEPAAATAIQIGDTITAEICAGEDVDYYTFSGSAGDHLVVDVDGKTIGSPLDARLYLYAADGASILAEHDDEITADQMDPHLGYQLPYTGQYYLKVQAWNWPEISGTYQFSIFTDNTGPSLTFNRADGDSSLPDVIDLTATATDNESGISHVDFWAFVNNQWEIIESDWDAQDGWQASYDASALSDGTQLYFYAQASNWAGISAGKSAWPVYIDTSPPNTTAPALPGVNDSTAIYLTWESVDAYSDIRTIHVRHEKNAEGWLTDEYAGTVTNTWFVGDAGANYAFRVRGIDTLGIIEAYTAGAVVNTAIPGSATLCQMPDPWDTSGSDNAFGSATPLSASPQTHNFCNPLRTDRLHDNDWFSFWASAGETYTVQVNPQHPASAAQIELYRADGNTLIKRVTPAQLGNSALLSWKADQDGVIYVRISHIEGRVVGDVVTYEISLQAAKNVIYLPLVVK